MLSLLPFLVFAALGCSDPLSCNATPPSVPAVDLSKDPTYALLDSPMRHVRTTDRQVQRLLRVGVTRSPTFASLVTHLNGTDVIVYIEPVATLPTTLAGRLLLMPLANQQRYLRIQIALLGSTDELVALIGHELRHAVEVADAPDVRNESALVRLYERIGTRSSTAHTYETDAARSTARVVRHELIA